MFVRDFVHLHQPFEVVAPRFAGDAHWLEPVVESVLAEVSAPLEAATRGRAAWQSEARCTRGPQRAREGALVIPLSWAFDPDPWALSPLKTDLSVQAIDAAQCAVSVEALVRRPTELHAADPQHAAETVLRGFLQKLATVLGRES